MWTSCPGAVTLVPDRGGLGGADHLTGQRVTLAQVRHLVPAQDSAHGPGRDVKLCADPVLPPTLRPAQVDDLLFGLWAGSPRAVVRAGGTLVQTGLTLGLIAGHPVMHGLAGHTHLRGHMSLWAPLPTDTIHDRHPPVERQPRISVGHETSGCGD
jgi:hypothetical protein